MNIAEDMEVMVDMVDMVDMEDVAHMKWEDGEEVMEDGVKGMLKIGK